MGSSNSSIKDWKPTTVDKQPIPSRLTICPKCSKKAEVIDVAGNTALDAGIHYLTMRCINCGTRVDAAGIGVRDAYKDYAKKMRQLEIKLEGVPQFKIEERNMWSYIAKADAICVTTNGFVKKDGTAVMGRGCAAEAVKRYPKFSRTLGKYIKQYGNRPFKIELDNNTYIVSFPVKPEYRTADDDRELKEIAVEHMFEKLCNGENKRSFIPGWACKAHPEVIRKSCIQLKEMADKFSWEKIVLPCPGVGAGELSYEEVVRPILIEQLDERFIVVFKPRSKQ